MRTTFGILVTVVLAALGLLVAPAVGATTPMTTSPFDDSFYFPLAHPVRLLDTRHDPAGPLAGGEVRRVGLAGMNDAGRPGDHPQQRGTVVFNVTVTNASSAGYLTAWDGSAARPETSNLNWVAGQTVSDEVFSVTLGNDALSVFVSSGPVDVVVDASGYFPFDAVGGSSRTHYVPLPAPDRVYDSRLDNDPMQEDEARTIRLGLTGNTPAENRQVLAAAVTVTAADATNPGYLTAWDGQSDLPPTSTVNYETDQPVANSAIVPLACLETDGDCSDVTLGIFNGSGRWTDVIVDVTGYYVLDPDGNYLSFVPTPALRIGDSRTPVHNPTRLSSDTAAGVVDTFNPSPVAEAPRAAVVTITAVQPTAPTYLSVFTSVGPTVSSISNPSPGRITAAVAQPALTPNRTFDVFNAAGAVDIVVDLAGFYFQSSDCTDCGALASTSARLARSTPVVVRSFTPVGAR